MATGTTRNKVSLKPGHSLMDWVRLGNSGMDLTGFQGRTISISGEELAKHNNRDDAWMAIRGKVYNITHYMNFHPGGVDELMRGAGRDATKLFDEVHAWVNYQQLLEKCYIGPLKHISTDRNKSRSSKLLQGPLSIPTVELPIPLSSEIIPRLDWIQKRSDLSLYFYTRQNCNPGLFVQRKANKEFRVCILIEQIVHQFVLELQHNVIWPPKSTFVNSETGKIEISFEKVDEELWTLFGTHKVRRISLIDLEMEADCFYFEYEVFSNKKINHDSVELCLNNKDNILIPPIGFHVTIGAFVRGKLTRKSYTPVDSTFFLNSHLSENKTNIYFLIKSYGDSGLLSTFLSQSSIGSPLQISIPKGNFILKSLSQQKQVILLAAGSGLTPCLSLIQHILKVLNRKIEHIALMYFNKTEADIWCRENLEKLTEDHDRFKYFNVLSQPSPGWSGLKGNVTAELVASTMEKDILTDESFAVACGPKAFNDAVENSLKKLEFKPQNIHLFY